MPRRPCTPVPGCGFAVVRPIVYSTTILPGWPAIRRSSRTGSTPVATVTPRLEQEFRYDIFWQGHADGTTTENYGGGKGLELIPANNVEVIVNLPPYIVHNNPKQVDGWATNLSSSSIVSCPGMSKAAITFSPRF